MKQDVIKVLQINAENFGAGGISVIIWRVMKELEGSNVQISFLSQRDNADEKYVNEIRSQGGDIHYIRTSTNKILRYFDRYKECCKVIKDNKYDIVHINGNESFGIISYVLAAKKSSDCKVVVHAHSTRFMNGDHIVIKKIFKAIFQPLLIKNADCIFACSREAARFMYGRAAHNAIIIKNGLNFEHYAFDNVAREKIRNKMDVNNKIVIGHIGRFVYPKNHEFILEVFAQVNKNRKDVELWLIGEKQGEGYEKMYRLVKQKGLQEKVKFLGNTEKVKEYLSAMDVLLFPSRFEGLPLVLVEAQANGLPVVCSDVITDEAIFAKNVEKLSLDEKMNKWVDEIIRLGEVERKAFDGYEEKENGFNITKSAEVIEEEYKRVMSGLE